MTSPPTPHRFQLGFLVASPRRKAIILPLGGLLVTLVALASWYLLKRPSADDQYNLGIKYSLGDGVTKSQVESVKCFRQAAEQGHTYAQYALGMSYELGHGVDKDPAEAIKWLEKAANHGDEDAQLELGKLYRDGQGVTKDYVQAYMWFDIACILEEKLQEKGVSIRAIHSDLKKQMTQEQIASAEKAISAWQLTAAQRGVASGQFALGTRYFNGVGVPKDKVQAYKWIFLALRQMPTSPVKADKVVIDGKNRGPSTIPSTPIAKRLWLMLNIVENEMTSEQIAEAQRFIKQFRPQK
jgi:TPR repeat protein